MASVLELAGKNLVVGPTLEDYNNEYIKNTNCFYYGSYEDIKQILLNLYLYYANTTAGTRELNIMWVAICDGGITDGSTTIAYAKYDLLITNISKTGNITTVKLKNMVNYGLSSL